MGDPGGGGCGGPGERLHQGVDAVGIRGLGRFVGLFEQRRFEAFRAASGDLDFEPYEPLRPRRCVHLLESDPGAVRSRAYDVIMDGVELGGGSIRINDPNLPLTLPFRNDFFG